MANGFILKPSRNRERLWRKGNAIYICGFSYFLSCYGIFYYVFPDRWKKVWLLASNYCFYLWAGGMGALLLLHVITAITWLSGILAEKADVDCTSNIKKRQIWFGVIAVLTILCICKYGGSIVNHHFGKGNFQIFLPIGLSFYSLQAIAYVTDVYRKKLKAEKSYINYSLFLSFFPTIQSGPIEKAENFIPQLKKSQRFDYDKVKNGLLLMLWGFFEKIAVADMAAVFVNSVYENYEMYSGGTIWIATILYAFQLYADFDGYSNIAVGAAGTLGYDLVNNFRQPYFAMSVKDFWRRWHVSLSGWLREYVYIPLGGNKKGNKYVHIFVTFLVSGLWHGEKLHYLVWGALHGCFQVIEGMVTDRLNVKNFNGGVFLNHYESLSG